MLWSLNQIGLSVLEICGVKRWRIDRKSGSFRSVIKWSSPGSEGVYFRLRTQWSLSIVKKESVKRNHAKNEHDKTNQLKKNHTKKEPRLGIFHISQSAITLKEAYFAIFNANIQKSQARWFVGSFQSKIGWLTWKKLFFEISEGGA